MSTEYEIDYAMRKRLLALDPSREERAAINRLSDFEGTAADMRLVIKLLRKHGEDERAELLASMLEGDEDEAKGTKEARMPDAVNDIVEILDTLHERLGGCLEEMKHHGSGWYKGQKWLALYQPLARELATALAFEDRDEAIEAVVQSEAMRRAVEALEAG